MKKFILITSIATVLLASCGKTYLVHNVDTNRLEYLYSGEGVGDHKVGDTIHMQNVHRVTAIGNAFETTKFTGVVIAIK